MLTQAHRGDFVVSWLRSPWLRPLNDVAAFDDIAAALGSSFSLATIRARVVGERRENDEVRTLLLRPNRLWPGHRAGQHLRVTRELDGRLVTRSFSIASAPRRDGLLEITVKRQPKGRLSRWWNDEARVGDLVTLSPPAGDFTLPRPLPHRLVMLAAGSGITPVLAMLRALTAPQAERPRELSLVCCFRSREEAIATGELESMARRHAWLKLQLRWTQQQGRLTDAELDALARRDADAWACGPESFLAAALGAWRRAGRDAQLRIERFRAPLRTVSGESCSVEAGRSGSRFEARRGESLLEAAERAGLRPAHGCRIGICHTCKCRKLSGQVEDLRDGRVSGDGDETIQLCITTARTPLLLEL